MSEHNLDRLCAEYGYKFAMQVYEVFKSEGGQKDKAKKAKTSTENHITKSLGVLQEDGVYAFFLYQASRGKSEEAGAARLSQLAAEMLGQETLKLTPFDTLGGDPLKAVRGGEHEGKRVVGLAEKLDDLLLAKRLLEQALIYARYHAKALLKKRKEND